MSTAAGRKQLDLLAVQETLERLLQHQSPKASVFCRDINSLAYHVCRSEFNLWRFFFASSFNCGLPLYVATYTI